MRRGGKGKVVTNLEFLGLKLGHLEEEDDTAIRLKKAPVGVINVDQATVGIGSSPHVVLQRPLVIVVRVR